MQKFQTGDEVLVTAGKDKGKQGTVKTVFENDRILVDGINMAKKHVKPNPNAGVQGGIEDIEMPIHRSNIMHFDKV